MADAGICRMSKAKPPRTIDQASALLTRFAALDGEIEGIEAVRIEQLGAVNATQDRLLAPLLEEREAIVEQLAPWWAKDGDALTKGARKSIELAGCMIGSRTGRAVLEVPADMRGLLRTLARRAWGKALLRTTVTLDKAAAMRAVEGKYRRQLATLGVTRKDGEERFFVERVAQGGVIDGTASQTG